MMRGAKDDFQHPSRPTQKPSPPGWAPGLDRDLGDQMQLSNAPRPMPSIGQGRRERSADSLRFHQSSEPTMLDPSSALHMNAAKICDPGVTQLRSIPPRAQEAPAVVTPL